MKLLNQKLVIITAISILFIILCNSANAQTEFSGTWKMDIQKSEFGGLTSAMMYKEIKILQNKDSLITFGMRINEDDFPTTAVSYPFNGNIVKFKLPGNRTMTSTIGWSDDGNVLNRNSSYAFADSGGYESKETWVLSEDKKELTITRTFKGGNNDATVKAVYEKQ